MIIKKKRIDSTAVILVGSTLYTLEGVTDTSWAEILEAIISYQDCEDGTIKQAGCLADLLDLIDEDTIYRRKFVKKIIAEAIDNGSVDPDKDNRMRAAKRIKDISDIFEYDEEGSVYLNGFSHPMPKIMTEAILDAHYNPNSRYTVTSLVNFWKYLVLNPDKHIREELFMWIKTSKFSITEEGNVIAYRNVDVKKAGRLDSLNKFILESWTKVKTWKKSVKNYNIWQDVDGKYLLLPNTNPGEGLTFKGNLSDLSNKEFDNAEDTVYTDNYSKTMEIIINQPVKMNRADCDNDSNSSCSRGLHAKSAQYGLNLGSEVLVTLVNPYNIVAIPTHDRTKFRSCEYLPISRAVIEDYKLVEFEPGTYDIKYHGLDDLLKELSESSLEDLKAKGLISDQINSTDLKAIIEVAEQVINTRVIKVQ